MPSAQFASLPRGRLFPAQCLLFVLVTVDLNQRTAAFANCPSGCRCDRNTTYIRCVNLNLTSVSRDLPTTIQILVFSANMIIALRNSTFSGLHELTLLSLNANRIQRIDGGSFFPLINIRVLHLDANRIRTIHPDMFVTNTLLTEVDLSDNELTSVDARTFNYLTRLRTLKLARNRLTSLAGDTFAGLGLLRTLDISGNRITAFEPCIFSSLLSLTYLNISKMALQSLPISAFANLSALQTLDVSGNRLTTIDARHFEHFHSLRYLNLFDNPLTCDCRAVALRRWLEDTHFGVAPSMARRSAVCVLPLSRDGFELIRLPVEELACLRNNSTAVVLLRNAKVMEPSRYANGYTLSEYDPKIGWYTAATLSAMLIGFLLCIVLDKLKRVFVKRRKRYNESIHGSIVRKTSDRGAPSSGDKYYARGTTRERESNSHLRVDKTEQLKMHAPPGYATIHGHQEQNRKLEGECDVLLPSARSSCKVQRARGVGPRRARSQDDSCRVLHPRTLATQTSCHLPQVSFLHPDTQNTNDNLADRSSCQPLSVIVQTEARPTSAPTAATTNNTKSMLCVPSNDASRWRCRSESPTSLRREALTDTVLMTVQSECPAGAVQGYE